ncbi:MAG: hypothetical protein GC159_05835 [Phycisphaera sp.]|nr:hypothetical protein [Phycisphaera sp.]
MRLSHVLLALALITCSLTAGARADDAAGVDLRPLWTDGQSARYRINQIEVTTAAIQGLGEPQSSTVEINVEVSWEVTKANPDGGGTARMTLDKITMKMTAPGGEAIEVDGRGGDERTQSMNDWINAMTGTPMDVTVGANGSIDRVSGFEAIKSKAGDGGDKLDEDYFKEIAMDLAVLVGGRQGVKPGDTWKHQHDSDHRLGKIAYDTTYELKGVENIAGVPVALVSRTSDMKLTPEVPDVGDEAKVDIAVNECKETSQVMVDMSRHEIVGGTSDQVIDITITISAGGRQFIRTAREQTSSQIIRLSEK